MIEIDWYSLHSAPHNNVADCGAKKLNCGATKIKRHIKTFEILFL